MNNQEIFDTVARHLIKQGKPAKAASGACKYRTADGLMCAVGCLIPDGAYDPRMEGNDVFSAIEIAPHAFSGIAPESYGLLNTLQSLHDDEWTNGADIRRLLRGVAHGFGLNADAVSP